VEIAMATTKRPDWLVEYIELHDRIEHHMALEAQGTGWPRLKAYIENIEKENQRLRDALKEADKALQHYSGKYKHTANEARDKIKAALEGKR
jgi:hypothetical protein